MSERITRVAARGFQGLDFDEAVPERLLLTGPNGSGKTKRLRAIAFGLLGPPGKDGLQPWATSDLPSVVVEGSTGLKIQRATKIARTDGMLSCSNRNAVEPSQGEKTREAVESRIERELAPNVISLTIDAFWTLSGAERRRALLEALGADAALSPAAILSRLDAEFLGSPNEPASVVRVAAWNRIRAAARPTGDGFAYLAALEGAAKAQASEYRAQKDAQDALARTPAAGTPVADPTALRRQVDACDAEIRELEAARAAGKRGADDRARRIRERDTLRGRWPALALPPAERDAAIEKAVADANAALPIAHAAKDAAGRAATAAEDTHRKALEAHARADGRLRALRALLSAESGAEDGTCPVCGNADYDSATGDAMIERAVAAAATAKTKKERTAAALEDAAKRHDEAQKAAAAAGDALVAANGLQSNGAMLRECEAAIAAGEKQATAVADDAALSALTERRTLLRSQLDAAMKAEGERKARQDAGRLAEEAGEKMKIAVAIQARVGPKGMQGELLEGPVGRLAAAMNARWESAGKPGELAWALTDARGGPDATLVWKRPGFDESTPMPFSSGEKAVAVACLIAALAAAKPGRMSVALIEGGEVDAMALRDLTFALHDAPLANVVIATHVALDDALLSLNGFEIRRLPLALDAVS